MNIFIFFIKIFIFRFQMKFLICILLFCKR
nr:MAG TPA: hypothetical protein [Caudoviricetes sp.]